MNSMTGYAKHDFENDFFKIKIELKTVNNKNLNLKIKMPYFLNFMENKIRTLVSKYITRAYVELRIDFEDKREVEDLYEYDSKFSHNYMNILKQLEVDFNEKIPNKLEFLARQSSFIKKNDISIDEKIYEENIFINLEEALKKLNEMRASEGNELKKYFLDCIKNLQEKLDYINENKDKVVEEYKEKLLERLNKMDQNIDFDEKDILKEILIFTDRSDISEETSRLESHIKHFKSELNSNKNAIGKKMDFILQEMFRELNTAGVKSNYYEIAQSVVEAKTEVEKIREQVQNIE